MIKKNIIVLITLVIILLATYAFAEAKLKYSSNGSLIKWDKSIVRICIDDSAKNIPSIADAVINGTDTWNNTKISPFVVVDENNCDINIRRSRLIGWPEPMPLAVTRMYFYTSNGCAIGAEIIINSYYDSRIGDILKSQFEFDIQSIITHEIGHALGLDEDYDDTNSSMYVFTDKKTTHKRQLNKSDINAISKVYPNKRD